MAKENPWFKFEPAEWMFGRIQRQTPELKGVFIDLICKYWHRECEMSVLDAELDFGKENIDVLFSKGIIHNNNDESYISISFLDEQMDGIKKTSEKNSKSGKASAAKRKSLAKQKATTVEPPLNDPLTDKKREDKKIKEKIIPTQEEFVSYAMEKGENLDKQKVILKYESWVENGWKDGNDNEIKNWKSKVLSLLTYDTLKIKLGFGEKPPQTDKLTTSFRSNDT
ncbi:hypothetical protein DRO61_10125 [Candidatus Bathyarchaeota archaeon]|nr:MAG: hypothetical protein DRO61_10125 [Candidatus Bathyarchaeota archaeon]